MACCILTSTHTLKAFASSSPDEAVATNHSRSGCKTFLILWRIIKSARNPYGTRLSMFSKLLWTAPETPLKFPETQWDTPGVSSIMPLKLPGTPWNNSGTSREPPESPFVTLWIGTDIPWKSLGITLKRSGNPLKLHGTSLKPSGTPLRPPRMPWTLWNDFENS